MIALSCNSMKTKGWHLAEKSHSNDARAHTDENTSTKGPAIWLHGQCMSLWEWRTWAGNQISSHPSHVELLSAAGPPSYTLYFTRSWRAGRVMAAPFSSQFFFTLHWRLCFQFDHQYICINTGPFLWIWYLWNILREFPHVSHNHLLGLEIELITFWRSLVKISLYLFFFNTSWTNHRFLNKLWTRQLPILLKRTANFRFTNKTKWKKTLTILNMMEPARGGEWKKALQIKITLNLLSQ